MQTTFPDISLSKRYVMTSTALLPGLHEDGFSFLAGKERKVGSPWVNLEFVPPAHSLPWTGHGWKEGDTGPRMGFWGCHDSPRQLLQARGAPTAASGARTRRPAPASALAGPREGTRARKARGGRRGAARRGGRGASERRGGCGAAGAQGQPREQERGQREQEQRRRLVAELHGVARRRRRRRRRPLGSAAPLRIAARRAAAAAAAAAAGRGQRRATAASSATRRGLGSERLTDEPARDGGGRRGGRGRREPARGGAARAYRTVWSSRPSVRAPASRQALRLQVGQPTNLSPPHSSIHSLIHSFIRSFIHCLPLRSIPSFTSSIPSLIHLLSHSIFSSSDSLIIPCICPIVYFYPSIHALVHLSIHSIRQEHLCPVFAMQGLALGGYL